MRAHGLSLPSSTFRAQKHTAPVSTRSVPASTLGTRGCRFYTEAQIPSQSFPLHSIGSLGHIYLHDGVDQGVSDKHFLSLIQDAAKLWVLVNLDIFLK